MVMDVIGAEVIPEQVKDDAIDVEGKVEDEKIIDKDDDQKLSHLLDNSNEEIGEIKEAASAVPKDPLDEWPLPKQTHTFSFVRHRSYEDPKIKAKIEQAHKEIQRKTQARTQIIEVLKAKKAERADIISQLKQFQDEQNLFWEVINEKRKEMEPLQAALGKLRGTNSGAMEKSVCLCSSEEELNQFIQSVQYRIQHESNTLAGEKQLLKQIKQLEASRNKVIANAAIRAKIHESFGQRDAIQDQVKLIGADLDGVRKEKQATGTKIRHLKEKKDIVNIEIDSLNKELDDIAANREKAYQTLVILRKDRENSNACFFQYRSLINNVKGLAAKKDIVALQELSYNEVENFMSQWNTSKSFREDYDKRILSSLDIRVLSRDGRMRNPEEKPILSEGPVSTKAEIRPAKLGTFNEKENKIPPRYEEMFNDKAQEQVSAKPAELEVRRKAPDTENTDAEDNSKNESSNINEMDTTKLKEMNSEEMFKDKVQEQVTAKPAEVEVKRKTPDTENTDAVDNSKNEYSNINEMDATELKEMNSEEEIAKTKLAMERKEKKAEKAAAEAAATRAQKKARKKQKEKEKKAKKKAATLSQQVDTEQPEKEREYAIQKIQEEANLNAKAPTQGTILRNRSKGQNQIHKIILKRKNSKSYYWLWAVPAAICALLLVVFGYYLSHGKIQ